MSTMRAVALLLAALCFIDLASASYHHVPHKLADRKSLVSFRRIYKLLQHFRQCRPLCPDIWETAKSYQLENHKEDFKNPEAVTRFVSAYKDGCIPKRGKPYSVYQNGTYPARLLVDVWHNAKNVDVLYKFATWARVYLSADLFEYAFLVHYYIRNNPYSTVLPAPYEISPEHYIPDEVLLDAWQAVLEGKTCNRKQPYVVYVNYSSCANVPEDDWVMSYFTQDVRFQAHQALLRYYCPFWAKLRDYYPANFTCTHARRGDFWYFWLKYTDSRYAMERLSNYLPDIEPIDYQQSVCGVESNSRHVQDISKSKRRLENAIDAGYAIDCEGKKHFLRGAESSDIFASMVEGNADSINSQFYGSLYRSLVALQQERIDSCYKHTVGQPILNRRESAFNSPGYYRIVRFLVDILDRFKDRLGPYSRKELLLPCVNVEAVNFDKLYTYMDYCDFELTNGIPVKNQEEALNLKVLGRQRCLKHEPFTYRLKVNSNNPLQVLVRTFVGPLYDIFGKVLSPNERRRYMYILDSFVCKLKKGNNELVRNSTDFGLLSDNEPLSYSKLLSMTEAGIAGKKKLYLDDFVQKYGYISHLMLPKGRPCGLKLYVHVIVTQYKPNENSWIHPATDAVSDFPWDKLIIKQAEFSVPNSRSCQAVVYHRDTHKADGA